MAERIQDPLSVTVVLVTWNNRGVLPACLESLGRSEPLPAELIAVDNGSDDDSADIVRSWGEAHPTVELHIIENDTNRGFAPAVNQAIELGSQPFVCLLNPDLRLRPDTLCQLYDALQRLPSNVAVAGGKLLRASGDGLDPTGLIDSAGIVMTRDGRHFDRGAGQRDDDSYDNEEDVFGITGALAFFRRDALEASRVDGEILDEDFFAYREDADLAWRLQGFGYRARYIPSAVAYHRRSVTPERRRALHANINYHSVKNRFLLRIHHADRSWLLRFGLRSMLRDIVVVGACLTVERSSLPAFAWLWQNRTTHLRRRRDILSRRQAPSEGLGLWFR